MPRGSLAGFLGGGKQQKAAQATDLGLVQELKAGLALPFTLAPPAAKSEEGNKDQDTVDAGTQALEQSKQGEHPPSPHPALPHIVMPGAGSAEAEAQPPHPQHTLDEAERVEGEEGGSRGSRGEREGEEVGTSSEAEEEQHGLVPGAAVGLPAMDYVPISINEMKRAARKSKAESKGGKGSKSKGDGSQHISRSMLPSRAKDALKRKYIMGLEDNGEDSGDEDEGNKAGKKRRLPQSSSSQVRQLPGRHGMGSGRAGSAGGGNIGEDTSDSSSSDSDNAGPGLSSKGRRRVKAGGGRGYLGAGSSSSGSEAGDGEEPQGANEEGVVAFDYDAAHQQADEVKKARARREAQQQRMEKGRAGANRGRGGGRGRQQQQQRGGAGAKGGRRPAFNPYHIPDENLMKAGKRSTVMPRSGNRTLTFK